MGPLAESWWNPGGKLVENWWKPKIKVSECFRRFPKVSEGFHGGLKVSEGFRRFPKVSTDTLFSTGIPRGFHGHSAMIPPILFGLHFVVLWLCVYVVSTSESHANKVQVTVGFIDCSLRRLG